VWCLQAFISGTEQSSCNARKTLLRHLYLLLLCLQKPVGDKLRRPKLRQRIEPDRVDDNPNIVTPFPLLLKQSRRARLLHLHQPHIISTTIHICNSQSRSTQSILRCYTTLLRDIYVVVILTLGQEAGLRRVKPCSWSVYRSSSSPSGTPLSPCASAAAAAAAASDAEATGSCGDEAGKGRVARSSVAADTALRVRTGGWEGEASHLGATARAQCGRRRWRPASASGGPQRGQTSDMVSRRGLCRCGGSASPLVIAL
jgi:hypothetical protein